MTRALPPATKIAVATLAAIVLLALLAPWILPDPNAITDPVGARLLGPSWQHLLGTDTLSRDLLARLARGGAISLAIGVSGALLATSIGCTVGFAAGTGGPLLDTALMRGIDALASVPRAFVVLFVAAAWDGMPPWAFTLLLGLTGWFVVARLVRAEVRRLMGTDAILAARALGAGRARIIFRHLLPNVAGQVVVATALAVGEMMLLEAGLSFLGAGLRPPTASWGVMIHEGKDVLATAPRVSLLPGLALTIAVLAVNRLGDTLRDALDPRA